MRGGVRSESRATTKWLLTPRRPALSSWYVKAAAQDHEAATIARDEHANDRTSGRWGRLLDALNEAALVRVRDGLREMQRLSRELLVPMNECHEYFDARFIVSADDLKETSKNEPKPDSDDHRSLKKVRVARGSCPSTCIPYRPPLSAPPRQLRRATSSAL